MFRSTCYIAFLFLQEQEKKMDYLFAYFGNIIKDNSLQFY